MWTKIWGDNGAAWRTQCCFNRAKPFNVNFSSILLSSAYGRSSNKCKVRIPLSQFRIELTDLKFLLKNCAYKHKTTTVAGKFSNLKYWQNNKYNRHCSCGFLYEPSAKEARLDLTRSPRNVRNSGSRKEEGSDHNYCNVMGWSQKDSVGRLGTVGWTLLLCKKVNCKYKKSWHSIQ